MCVRFSPISKNNVCFSKNQMGSRLLGWRTSCDRKFGVVTHKTNKQTKKKKKKGIIVHFLGPCDTPAFPTEKTSCIATVFSLTYQKVKQYRVPCVITILLCSSRRCFSSKPKGLFMHIQLSKSVKSLCDRGRVFEHSLKAAPTIKHITEQPYLTS